MQEHEQNEKEIIEGYEIKYSMKVGGKRFAFGIHIDPKHKDKYFEGVITYNDIFANYEGYASDDYFDIMHRLLDRMTAELQQMEQKRDAIGMADISCLKREDLIPVSGDESIVGKVVAIDEKYLHDGYKDISHQLYLTDGGFGAEGGGRGRACFCWDLYRQERDRIERPEVIGIVPPEKLPDFAKATLAKIESGELTEQKYIEMKTKREKGTER